MSGELEWPGEIPRSRPSDSLEVRALLDRLEEALRGPDPLARVRAFVAEARAAQYGEHPSGGAGAGPPSAPWLPPLDRPVELAHVARFVREVIVRAHAKAGRVVVAPLVPVIGLPGAGKTCFLTALGHVLTEQRARYHFPYDGEFVLEPLSLAELVRAAGGEPAHAEALRPWILDFGRDFARRRYDAFLRHASWPPRTHPALGARFLVAQVKKDGAPYARLVSVEVAGEALRPVFEAGTEADPLAVFRSLADDESSPSGVAADSLDRATGIVLLVDSTRTPEHRAEAHKPFLDLLARSLRSRAGSALLSLALRLETEEATRERTTLAGVLHRLRRSHARFGEELCLELESPLLGALAEALEPGASIERGSLRRFVRDLAAVPDEKALLGAIGVKLSEGLTRPEEGRRAPELPAFDGWVRAAARLRGVPLEVARRLVSLEQEAGELECFRPLRSLSIVETKTDVGRPISPFNLAGCAPALEEIRAALRLAGGDLRHYEATVTGYAAMSGAGRAPGPYSTQTPINVLEPVFDALGVPRDDGTGE